MAQNGEIPGALEAALRAHHASPPVLYEARALDRELARTDVAWDVLLRGAEAYVAHYAAVLLHQPAALDALGRGLFRAVKEAPAVSLRARAASALLAELASVSTEVKRAGIDQVEPAIPASMAELIRALHAHGELPFDRGRLVPPILAFGRQLVLMAEEAPDPGLWFALLADLNQLLWAITRRRVAGEPTYDGRWDSPAEAGPLAVHLLAPVRQARIAADLAWLDDLQASQKGSPEVFLELAAYERRDERERAFLAWFDEVARSAADRRIPPATLVRLCEGLADWIATAEDREFLAALSRALQGAVPDVLKAAPGRALAVAIETFGVAIAQRLAREAGRGERDPALRILWAVAADLVERRAKAGSEPDQALDLALEVRTGPVVGAPCSADDAVFRLGLIPHLPNEAARRALLSLVSAFSLEAIRLAADDDPPGAQRNGLERFLEECARLLGREAEPRVVQAVRLLLRVAPISPVELSGAQSPRALQWLAAEEPAPSYLADLRARLLYRPGPDNRDDVERVLAYWSDGRTDQLEGLATPDSLAALGLVERRDRQIGRLLQNLAAHAPGRPTAPPGFGWLAQLPEAFLEPSSLVKIAGFEGLAEDAVGTLAGLLGLLRALEEKYRPHAAQTVALPESELLAEADLALESRRKIQAGLLAREAPLLPPLERLEPLARERALQAGLDATLEQLAGVCLACGADRACAARAVARMVAHAKLSGLLSDLPAGVECASTLDEGLRRTLREHVANERRALSCALEPFASDALVRLWTNPLARPAAAYRRWIEDHRGADPQQAGAKLAGLLADDLFAQDGGLLLLLNFLERL